MGSEKLGVNQKQTLLAISLLLWYPIYNKNTQMGIKQ